MKSITFTTLRLSVAMPLILGLATMAAAPTAQAMTIEAVNILNGGVDATQGGVVNTADDVPNVIIQCLDAAAMKVDIVDGFFDLDEDGVLGEAIEDLTDCDFVIGTGVPSKNVVNILNGRVDVDQNNVININDDLNNVEFLRDVP